MKRLTPFLAPLVLATVFFVACEDSQLPTQNESESPALAISDGAHDDSPNMESNPDFFFLPPIVPNPGDHPDYEEGEFNPYLVPMLRICRRDDTSDCAVDETAMEINADSTHYAFGWKSGEPGTTSGVVYRVSVYLGFGDDEVVLGYRDVLPVATPQEVPNHPEELDIYIFLNGNNTPIKVHIENGALCPDTKDCVTKSVDLQAGGDLVLTTGEALYVPPQDDVEGTPTLTMNVCRNGNGTLVSDLPIDLPKFGACVEIDDLGANVYLDIPAVVSMCDLDPAQLPPYPQSELVTLHRWHGYDEMTGEGGSVEALPHAHACEEIARINMPADESSGIFRYAKAGLRVLTEHVNTIFTPARLDASPAVLHRGMGGTTPIFSRFQFALPAEMQVAAGDGQVALVNTAVEIPPQVLVTDRDGTAVENARVRFQVTLGGGLVVPVSDLTDEDGFAFTSWTLGDQFGLNELRAYGIGIADPDDAGPFMPVDLGNPLLEFPVSLQTGELFFTAIACEPGYGSIPEAGIDGVMEDSEWQCAKSTPFTANLSGGSTADATLYWMNDADNLYLAVSVVRDSEDKVNTLRFEFDNTGDGRSEFDDIITLNGDLQQFSDMYADAKCAGSKQSSCGDLDEGGEAGQNGGGAQSYDPVTGRNVYEIWHPLSGDMYDVDLLAYPEIKLYLTLSLGKGAQGNTQWPGFKDYTSGAEFNILVPPQP
jgi:hypothetical protein